jgi:hypothetical protein
MIYDYILEPFTHLLKEHIILNIMDSVFFVLERLAINYITGTSKSAPSL